MEMSGVEPAPKWGDSGKFSNGVIAICEVFTDLVFRLFSRCNRMRMFLFAAFLGTIAAASAAESADTPSASYARSTQLKTKITLEARDMPLVDFMKEVAAEAEKQLVRTPKWTYAPDVSRTLKVTYRCKDLPIETVLSEVFKTPGLGYVVISNDADKLDGFIRITKGTERGFAKAPELSLADRQAFARLESARELIKNGQKVPAKAVLTLLTKDANPTVAKEAARLLESLDK